MRGSNGFQGHKGEGGPLAAPASALRARVLSPRLAEESRGDDVERGLLQSDAHAPLLGTARESTAERPSIINGDDCDAAEDGRMARHRARRGRLLALLLVLTLAAFAVATLAGRAARRLSGPGATANGPLDTREFAGMLASCSGSDDDSCLEEAVAKMPVHDAAKEPGDICNRLVVGSHHKTGTVLAKRLFRVLCPALPEGHRLNHIKPHDYIPGAPFVHFIRDPLEIVVSAYQYHQTTTEEWAVKSGYQAKLKNASLTEGLEMEYRRSLYDSVQEELDVYRHTTQHFATAEDVFTIREGDLAEREAFRFVVMALQRWLGMPLDPAPLEECCFLSSETRQRGTMHASKSGEKEELRRAVMAGHAGEMRKLRDEMDFPPTGLEPEGEWGLRPRDVEELGSTMVESDERRYWSCPPSKSHCVG